ncbi:hypothetical protein C2G38_2144097 [Gigaspora rosea]|uniref:Uncharacterized protein n=1 Tax=Gigaspora rosea TaxID=44941 RepID=A0A397V4X5_9GLOM|nr:hypothetical protein C2G38_2144097 [Gigaspora rosea]
MVAQTQKLLLLSFLFSYMIIAAIAMNCPLCLKKCDIFNPSDKALNYVKRYIIPDEYDEVDIIDDFDVDDFDDIYDYDELDDLDNFYDDDLDDLLGNKRNTVVHAMNSTSTVYIVGDLFPPFCKCIHRN